MNDFAIERRICLQRSRPSNWKADFFPRLGIEPYRWLNVYRRFRSNNPEARFRSGMGRDWSKSRSVAAMIASDRSLASQTCSRVVAQS